MLDHDGVSYRFISFLWIWDPAFSKPRCALVALFFCVRAISASIATMALKNNIGHPKVSEFNHLIR